MNNAASLATFAALVLLGVVLAYWSWMWLGPSPAPRAPAAIESSGGTSSATALFRVANAGAVAGSAAAGSIRLMGVAAASGERRGNAVLRLDGKKTVAVLQGEDIEPGLRLVEVHADHIVVERSGVRESLAWPDKAAK